MGRRNKGGITVKSTVSLAESLLLQAAERFMSQGDFPQAADSFDQVLTISPRQSDALHGLGVIASQQQLWPQAIDYLTQASHQMPHQPQVWYNLGIALKAAGKLEEAAGCFEKTLTLAPRHTNACNMLGNTLAALKRPQEALVHYQRAVEIDPNHLQAVYNLGLLLQEQGQLSQSVKCYEWAVTINPSFAPGWSNLGTILLDQGQEDDAAQCFRQAINCAPEFADPHINLGLILFRQHQHSQALAAAETTAALPDRMDFPHYSLGLLFAKLNRPEAARHHLTIALERDPGDAQGARLVLAGLGLEPVPHRSSDAQLQTLYQHRAAHWDQNTASAQSYRGHELVGKLFGTLAPAWPLAVLDAGCGTGLVGQYLLTTMGNAAFSKIDGIDLSAAMLEHAAAKGIYTHLHHGDLVSFMLNADHSYDAIISAATLIHFGDLTPVFNAAATAVKPGGRFIFTLFPGPDTQTDGAAISLSHGHAEGGCYLHSRPYVERWAQATGWTVEIVHEAVHEFDRGTPVMALVISLIRP